MGRSKKRAEFISEVAGGDVAVVLGGREADKAACGEVDDGALEVGGGFYADGVCRGGQWCDAPLGWVGITAELVDVAV